MNPKDIMTDAIHNFHPQYQQYTQYSSGKYQFLAEYFNGFFHFIWSVCGSFVHSVNPISYTCFVPKTHY